MMKQKKRWWWIGAAIALALIALLIFVFRRGSAPRTHELTGESLLENGAFSLEGEQEMPDFWYTDAYVLRDSYTEFSVAEGREGGTAAHIVNKIPNDARFAQTVNVEPDSLYRLSGYVKSSCAGGLGANLSIEGVYVFSESLYDTEGKWVYLELYGRTGPDQYGVTVFARLGGYSGEAEGEAWFDDIELTEVDSVPDGQIAVDWFASYPDIDDGAAANVGERTAVDDIIQLTLGTLLYLLLIAGSLQLLAQKRGLIKSRRAAFVLLLIAALALRCVIATSISGYNVDVGDFRAWADSVVELGPSRFYTQGGFCDYPPGYILILGAVGLLGRLFHNAGVSEFMIKLPPILADVIAALLLIRFAEKKKGVKRFSPEALIPAALYLFNPLVLLTGSGWGQSDAVMTLFLLIVVLYGMEERWEIAIPAYVLAVLIKPQALMFGPMGLVCLAIGFGKARAEKGRMANNAKRVGIGLLAGAILALAVVLPFSGGRPLSWILQLYQNTMGYSANATVNACNLYFLVGANWVGAEALAPRYFGLLAGLVLGVPALLTLLKRPDGKKSRLLTLAVLCAGCLYAALSLIFPLSWGVHSTILIALSVLILLAAFYISGLLSRLPLYGAALLTVLFCLGGMMHERYLFPAMLLYLLAWMIERDDRILLCAALTAVGGFLNVGCVLFRNARFQDASGHLNSPAYGLVSDLAGFEYLSAVLNIFSAGLGLYIALRRTDEAYVPAVMRIESASLESVRHGRVTPLSRLKEETSGWLREHKMDQKDWLICLGVTVVYACVAFFHLGSTVSPQTHYTFTSPDEYVVFDLGESYDDFRMLYMGGIHYYDSDFTVQTSGDGENWGTAYSCDMDVGGLFQWKYVNSFRVGDRRALTGRFVRLNADHYSLDLYEVLFRDAEGNVLPIASVTDSLDQDVSALTDEQDNLEGEPSWYNSMYFDEIYHARTAYEHANGLVPYETTHPPLGKVIMSWCVTLFGMTPFGWRFAGTLCGVLMLPGMYLLGRLLFKKRRYAVLAILLMALDCMHYTQTRIATIDSFVVLFIIWSVYFMLRWFFDDFFGKPLWKTRAPLALSGLFMGLAVASKWTGCYAGVGLAVLFFIGVWRRWQAVREARALEPKQREQSPAAQTAASQGVKRLLITVLSCLVWFVAVPLLIYYLSYIPYFAYMGSPLRVEWIVEAAQGMLDYHATPGLGMDHPYYSPWYEWPFSMTPMYYASDAYEPLGWASTILSFGNPAVWWIGILAMAAVLAALVVRQLGVLLRGGAQSLSPGPLWPKDERDLRPLLLIVCFAAQYLPWTLVPRGTYIYHYFPSVPFIILATALIAEYLTDWLTHRARRKASLRG
ncbi:MAG: glycosyltransferase family 39 protein, partial [Clostridia bacterium]|nr:glycosyltransferase family 39 protein [Clostridia bacterium]